MATAIARAADDAPADDDEEDLRVEATFVDYYMSAPLPPEALPKLPTSPCYLRARQVPVLRVFGATPAGQKTCVHIHGVFPYFYFRVEDGADVAFADPDALKQLLPQIARDLEAANVARHRQQQQQQPRSATGNSAATCDKLVAKLLIVQGMPFYGFHSKTELFVQIFLYNPRAVPFAVQALESGGIAERVFQPYEAHIPFLLQVFADYQIEGMNYVHCAHVAFRAPLPASQEHLPDGGDELRVLLRGNVPSHKVNGDASAIAQHIKGRCVRVRNNTAQWFDRQSSCVLEADVSADCILNPARFNRLQASMRGSKDLRNVPSLAAIWEEERRRRLRNGERGTPELSLSVERQLEESMSSTSVEVSTSSLLSQSFFQQRMQDALDTVLEEMAKNATARSTDSSDCHSAPPPTPKIDGSPLVGDVAQCGNSISTQSAFSFSQAECDGWHDEETSRSSPIAKDHPESKSQEDKAIVDLLLSMQARDQDSDVTVHKGPQKHYHDGDDGNITADEDEDEENSNLMEIGDILASQRPVESMQPQGNGLQPHKESWWEAGEDKEESSGASLLDVGSRRFGDAASSNQMQRKAEEIEDMEDLFPPLPPLEVQPVSTRVRELSQSNPPAQPDVITQSLTDDEEFDVGAENPEDTGLVLSSTQQANVSTQCLTDDEEFDVGAENSGNTGVILSSTHQQRMWIFDPPPPTIETLEEESRALGIEAIEYAPAHFSEAEDIPDKPMVFGGNKFVFEPRDLAHTPAFDTAPSRQQLQSPEQPATTWTSLEVLKTSMREQVELGTENNMVRRVRTPVKLPPSSYQVSAWVAAEEKCEKRAAKKARLPSHEAPSQSRSHRIASANASNVTLLSLEIFATSRSNLLPNPLHDRVEAIGYAVEAQEGPTNGPTIERGLIITAPLGATADNVVQLEHSGFCIESCQLRIIVAQDEVETIHRLEELTRQWDPDFLVGFEVQKASIGYLIDRAARLKVNIVQTLSRLPTTFIDARNAGAGIAPDEPDSESTDTTIGTAWGVTKASGVWIHGRHMLNIWRLARSEVKLSRYAREDVVRAVLKREIPIYLPEQLSEWYSTGGQSRWKVLRHTLLLATLNLQLLAKMELVTRTSEMARLFGMDFYSVLSRGSQYRVEAVMLRVTKRRNYLLVSPSREQVARQAPLECIPLVMEPHSAYYSDPVVVLDFQSLYPSLVIGYNLCYSTLLARLRNGLHAEFESALGVMGFQPSEAGLLKDRSNLCLAPNGTIFAPRSLREGVLPVILSEILSTRIMVKHAMKRAKRNGQVHLEKVLNARQLALKMLANVTYGYTAAGFSGRMPCAQLADAIVQTGRCTLEAAVRMVESNSRWNARVVYGDTDSLFVLLRGRSKTDAFKIGQEIADAVTATNPRPVTLKMEKVYMGCVLVSKKRYVGDKFEAPEQPSPVLDAKGVEIVRRDSCGVVQRAMRSCLEVLFRTSDLSQVKQTLEQLWTAMLDNRVPLKEFVFAKEVRLGTYARGCAPPAALVASKAMAHDPRAEPRYAERVAYVVVNGPPNARLADLVVSPLDVVSTRSQHRYSINHQYYIHKQIIPALERLFLLMGANLRAWYTAMPRSATKARDLGGSALARTRPQARGNKQHMHAIDAFYMSTHCRLCGAMGHAQLCADCQEHAQRSDLLLETMAARSSRALAQLRRVCAAHCERGASSVCCNTLCPIWNQLQLLREEDRQAEDEQDEDGDTEG